MKSSFECLFVLGMTVAVFGLTMPALSQASPDNLNLAFGQGDVSLSQIEQGCEMGVTERGQAELPNATSRSAVESRYNVNLKVIGRSRGAGDAIGICAHRCIPPRVPIHVNGQSLCVIRA